LQKTLGIATKILRLFKGDTFAGKHLHVNDTSPEYHTVRILHEEIIPLSAGLPIRLQTSAENYYEWKVGESIVMIARKYGGYRKSSLIVFLRLFDFRVDTFILRHLTLMKITDEWIKKINRVYRSN